MPIENGPETTRLYLEHDNVSGPGARSGAVGDIDATV